MLDMILQILAVLGIILLALLAVFLTIVLLVLFFPVTYRVYGKKDEGSIQCSGKIKWLFGLLRVNYSYPEWGHLTVKALCFTLFDTVIPGNGSHKEEEIPDDETGKKKSLKAKEREKSKTKRSKTKRPKTEKAKSTKNAKSAKKALEAGSAMEGAEIEKDRNVNKTSATDCAGSGQGNLAGTNGKCKNPDNTESDGSAFGRVDASSPGTDSVTGKEDASSTGTDSVTGKVDASSPGTDSAAGKANADSTEDGNAAEVLESSDEDNEAKGIDKIFLKFKKIKYTICGIYDKIKKIWKNILYYIEILQEEETKQLFKYALFRIGKILKHIRPKHIKANILFGTGSPDTTGYAYGAYCMLSSGRGADFRVIPDFERAVFQGEADISGHITIWVFAWNGLRLFFDKRFRKLLKKIKANL